MKHLIWHRRVLALLLAGMTWAHAQAQVSGAQPCPIPGSLEMRDIKLPHVRDAVSRDRKLVILTLGGAATRGRVAEDPAATYPARLEALLGTALAGVNVRVLNTADPTHGSIAALPRLAGAIAESGARLVIWATGSREAARSVDMEDYFNNLQGGIDLIRKAGADVILMDPQYAPSIARITNSEPYRLALHGTAIANEVPVLQRYDLMMHWNDEGLMNLDAQDKTERRNVARHLFACIAAALAPSIAAAAK